MSHQLPTADLSHVGLNASSDCILDEGRWITDDGIAISTYFVNLQAAPEFQWPNEMPVVAKGSSRRFAIRNCGTVRLSKPAKFREQGETLISDPNEGITNRATVHVDGAPDLDRAAEIDDEMCRGASALGRGQQRRTTSTRSSAETTHTYGKNCWIWCAGIAPQTRTGRIAWLESLGNDYDCVSMIASPRKFARALASAIVEQFGARGSRITWRHPSGKRATEHSSQIVFHGPVVYVEDPHAYVSQGVNDFERTLRATFFKHSTYVAQCEYRFVIWADSEPDELTLDLQATAEILAELRSNTDGDPRGQEVAAQHPLDSMQEAVGATYAAIVPDDASEDQYCGISPEFAAETLAPSQPMRALSTTDNATRTTRNVQLRHHEVVAPGKQMLITAEMQSLTVETSRYPLKEGHDVTSELELLPSARNARAHALHFLLHSFANETDYSKDLSAALFHAERVASRLLLAFVDPIERIAWNHGVIVITIKTPVDCGTGAEIAIGPHGSAQYRITKREGYEHVSCEDVFVASEVFIDDLRKLGLYTCEEAIEGRNIPMLPPITLPSKERPDGRIKRTAHIHRRTIEELSDVDEAEIDAANAEIEPRGDDARITKLIIDGGPGAILKMHGIRAGLSGTYRHRVRRDQLSVRVETMNPNATVEIDPSDSAPNQSGHVVTAPDGEDTVITVTATSPDGTAQSVINCIAERSREEEHGAA